MASLEKQLLKKVKEVEERAKAEKWIEPVKLVRLAHLLEANRAMPEAVDNLMRAAELYTESGFTLKVIGLLTDVLRLRPDHPAAQELLSRAQAEAAASRIRRRTAEMLAVVASPEAPAPANAPDVG